MPDPFLPQEALPSPPPDTITSVTSGGGQSYTLARTTPSDGPPSNITSLGAEKIAVLGTFSSPSDYQSIIVTPTLNSGITQYKAYYSNPTASSVVITNLWHFRADCAIGTTSIQKEYGFSFNKPDLATSSYGFYYGTVGSPSKTGKWGVFIDEDVSNYFEDLVLIGKNTSLGAGGGTEPEPILQVYDGNSKQGEYIESILGVGVRPDTRYQLRVKKGASATEACRFDGITHVIDVTDSTGTTSGALIVDGGAGIAKKLYVGSTTDIAGKLTVSTGGYDITGNSKVTGTLQVTGTLTKGGGTFDIEHPIEKGKRLRHSFVEGPRFDNIYRNKVQLQNGKASVNLDTDAVSPGGQTMTPGTWEKLNRNPDIFLQNNTGWDRVKGTIEGAILKIECEDSNSNDWISWMVVAERKDVFVLESDVSDDEGRLTLEYGA